MGPGAGGAGSGRRRGAEDRVHHQGVSDALAYGGGAGRYLRFARQYGAGPLDWHMYETVKGSDWLGDQDAIEARVLLRHSGG